ncbi:MAG: T9SS type A sorting domain-containing protein [Bacteroidales bacterium]|nr:T9SS type A sorting domain-containing protein [Bacteroidales bacterium]
MKPYCIARVLAPLILINFLFIHIGFSQDYADMRILQLITEEPCDPDQQISIQITNEGTYDIVDLPVTLRVNGAVMFEEVIAGPIIPEAVIVYGFSGTVDVSTTDYSNQVEFEAILYVPDDITPENNVRVNNIQFYNPDYIEKEGWMTYTPCNSPLTDMIVTAVVEHPAGTIWAGTGYGGIVKLENDVWSSITVESGDLLYNSIECMMLDRLDNLWVGYWNGEGASMWDGNEWIHYNQYNCGIVPGPIERILLDTEGNYWFASWTSGISVYDGLNWTNYTYENSELPSNVVTEVMQDHNGIIWIGTIDGVVKITEGVWEVLNTDNCGIAGNGVYRIIEDSNENIWFGGARQYDGISKFDGSSWQIYNTGNSGLGSNYITSIYEDSKGRLWFGTNQGGVSVLIGERWITYNTDNYLHSSTFWGDVTEDSDGNIWLPTYNGLMKKSPNTLDYLGTITNRPTCSGNGDGTILIDAIAENYPIYYSIDGGINFQTDSVFEELTYEPRSIAISDGANVQNWETVWTLPYQDIEEFPALESFEEPLEEISWYIEDGTAEWIYNIGSTPSASTGPEGDHTTGDGQYIYVEASLSYNEWAHLFSPCYNISELLQPKLEFWYSMYGEYMGNLFLDILSDGTWIENVMEFYGDQGEGWHLAELDLSPFGDIIKLRFRAQVGEHAYSDIALDDINIFNDFSSMETHFNTVWTGNGVDHMNFYALTAAIDGEPMQPYDEIAVFDGDYCVGVGMLNGVLENGVNYLSFAASNNDATPPDVNGFTEGHPISFKIWDYSEQQEIERIEITYVAGEQVFTIGEYTSFHLAASTQVDQVRDLMEGWNIASFYVIPDNVDMHALVQPLIDDGALLKVQDETGAAIENVEPIGWIFHIGDMSNTEGYKIKVNWNSSLVTTGFVVDLPFDISLQEGWNIIGFPSEAAMDAQTIFSDMIGSGVLQKVQDEKGNAMEYVVPIGWINNIGMLFPGEGYKVKVNQNSVLEINSSLKKQAVCINDPVLPAKHFMPSWKGNGLDHMNIYITEACLGGSPPEEGDEIGIFSEGLCVGAGVISGEGIISLKASLDDPLTEYKDGFSEGEPINLVLWSKFENCEFPATGVDALYGYIPTFEKMGTTVLKAVFDREGLFSNSISAIYPNPVTDRAYIRFTLEESGEVVFETVNLMGEKVMIYKTGKLDQGQNEITWKPFDANGNRLASGTYFIRIVTGDYSEMSRIVLF